MARRTSVSGFAGLTNTGGSFGLPMLLVTATFFGMVSPNLRSASEIGLLKAMARMISEIVITGSVMARNPKSQISNPKSQSQIKSEMSFGISFLVHSFLQAIEPLLHIGHLLLQPL